MELPYGFSVDLIGSAVGLGKRVHTIDVTTQQPGPRLTLGRCDQQYKSSLCIWLRQSIAYD